MVFCPVVVVVMLESRVVRCVHCDEDVASHPRHSVHTYTLTHSHTHIYLFIYIYTYLYIYRVSREECKILRESVPYVKIYRYNQKHLYPKLNGYGDKSQRKVWSTSGFHTLYLPADSVNMSVLQCGIILHLALSL
jgi:hypothetical protein